MFSLFIKYLRQNIYKIILAIVFSLIFLSAFLLYKLPLSAFIYPLSVCFLIAVVFVIFDFRSELISHKKICVLKNLNADMITEMPSNAHIQSSDYQDVIKNLKAEISELESEYFDNYNDMVEYYTVWVHQIKIPISAMKLTLKNEDSVLSRELYSDLIKIEQYVEMVLTFIRLDSASNDYVFKEYKLDDLIKQSVKHFSSEFIMRKINLEYSFVDKTIITDEKWFVFVLDQIISNALKYTKKGCVKIYLKDSDILCVEDTGIGIAKEDLPRIFENGYTGYNGRIDKKASGIGLYLCSRICKNLGIGISADSQIDKGTVIQLDLSQYKQEKNPLLTKL